MLNKGISTAASSLLEDSVSDLLRQEVRGYSRSAYLLVEQVSRRRRRRCAFGRLCSRPGRRLDQTEKLPREKGSFEEVRAQFERAQIFLSRVATTTSKHQHSITDIRPPPAPQAFHHFKLLITITTQNRADLLIIEAIHYVYVEQLRSRSVEHY